MDIRDFVKKQEAALKKYRRAYKLVDFLTIAVVLYTLMFLLNLDKAFALMSTFEVRAGTSYDIVGISVAFETVALALLSAFFALLLTFIIHRHDDRTGVILLVEQKYPILYEKLRTAYDNMDMDNLIVKDLLNVVSSSASRVSSSAFLKRRRLTFGIILILLSVSTLTYIVSNDIRSGITPEDINNLINGLPFMPQNTDTSGDLFEINDQSTNGSSSAGNLTGDTAIIVVDGKEVDLTLPAGTGVGFTSGQETNASDTNFDQSSPYERSVISSPAYDEKLPEGYESVIKSYFEKMAQK